MEPNLLLFVWFLNVVLVFGEVNGVPKNTVVELSSKAGYVAEPHTVTTEDGYILKVFRLRSPSLDKIKNKEPVFLLHGLLGSAENFVTSRNNSLGFLLASNKYDVWLGNARGNFHSRSHVKLDPDVNTEFWYFTLDQLGKYDLPAMIDYILKVTRRKSLSYVGHSQGCASFFAMASERPEYNNKIKIHVSLAPAVYMRNNHNVVIVTTGAFLTAAKIAQFLLNLYEIKAIFAQTILNKIAQQICGETVDDIKQTCGGYLDFFTSSHDSLMDYSLIPTVLDTTPAGGSIFQFLHYAQLYRTGEFEKYNWGYSLNARIHNSTVVPKYDLSKVTAPVALFYGLNDGMVNYKDVDLLAKSIPNMVELYKVPNDQFTHFDFLWSIDVAPLVYNKVLEMLNKYKNS